MRYLIVLISLVFTNSAYAQSHVKWVKTNHPGVASSVSFSSDGKYLVSTAWQSNELIVWNGETGEFLRKSYIGPQSPSALQHSFPADTGF